jgi:preprotein translocase subunit SecB
VPIAPAQLEYVWLGRVVFEPDPDATFEDVPKSAYNLTPGIAIGDIETNEEDGSRGAVVSLNAHIDFVRTDDTDGPTPFTLDITVHGVFRWAAGALPPTDELARGWLEYNGMYLLWPYLRAHTATLTGLSGFPALTIVTMNVPKPPVIPSDEAEVETAANRNEARDTEASPAPPPADS